jgi:hypothetical protein
MYKAEIKLLNDGAGEHVHCDVKESLLPWQKRGLQETVSGYGLKLTSRFMILFKNKWRRVYICQMGNSGVAYIGKPGRWEGIVDIWLETDKRIHGLI